MHVSSSAAIVPYRSLGLQAQTPRIVSFLPQIVDAVYKRSFWQAQYEAAHLKEFGEGRVFILMGPSSVGKSSIIQALTKRVTNAVNMGLDDFFTGRDRDRIKKQLPELYTTLCKALRPSYIAEAVFGMPDSSMIQWKNGVSIAEKMAL